MPTVMTHLLIRMSLLAFALTLAGCQQTNASPQRNASQHSKLLARMQAADANPDPLRRCLDYPSPPGVHWSRQSIEARCDLVVHKSAFLEEGAKHIDTAEGAAIWDAGFKSLMDDPTASLAIKDGRLNVAVAAFTSAELPLAEKWLARSQSPYAYAAKGASLLNAASTARFGTYSSAAGREDPDTTSRQARQAAEAFQRAYELAPNLSAACALRTTAMLMYAPRDSAVREARACAQAHPYSYFAVNEWKRASEPRWGGSAEDLREVSAFIKANRSANPLLESILGAIEADAAICTGLRLDANAIHALEKSVSHGPSGRLLSCISDAWKDLGELELWMAYLSSAVRFDIDPGDRYRRFRAVMNMQMRPEWAAIDYSILKEKYPSDPLAADLLADAERNVRDKAWTSYSTSVRVTSKGAQQRKSILMSECSALGTGDAKLPPALEDCGERLVAEWPNDPSVWFIKARVQHHRGHPDWPAAARQFLMLANASDPQQGPRIALIRGMLVDAKAALPWDP